MTKDPKSRFMEDKIASSFMHELATNPHFLKACDAALMQMLWQTRSAPDAQVALGGFHRMTGATDFLRVLLNLTEVPTAQKTADFNLNFKA